MPNLSLFIALRMTVVILSLKSAILRKRVLLDFLCAFSASWELELIYNGYWVPVGFQNF